MVAQAQKGYANSFSTNTKLVIFQYLIQHICLHYAFTLAYGFPNEKELPGGLQAP